MSDPEHNNEAEDDREPANGAGTRASYPNEYVWFVFVSALDVCMTTVILYFGGREANPLANSVLASWGLGGMIVFKFLLVLLVIGCCEMLARRRWRVGRGVARLAVVITAIPIVLAFTQLLRAAAK